MVITLIGQNYGILTLFGCFDRYVTATPSRGLGSLWLTKDQRKITHPIKTGG